MDDVQVVRIEEAYKELLTGQFPIRISSDLGNGAGYMLFNFYSPLIYYLGAIFHIVGFTLVISTKLTFISAFLIGWLGFIFLLTSRFKPIPAIFGVTTFLAASYVGYDAFHRGALAELFAMSLIPWLLYFAWKAPIEKSIFYSSGLTISVTLLIITHNLTTLMVLPFITLLAFFINPKRIINSVASILIGVAIAGFYWLPAVMEKQYIAIDKAEFVVSTYKTHLLTVLQLSGLERPEWGFLPPHIGTSIFIGTIISIILLLFSLKRKFKEDRLLIFCAISFILSIFLASNLSRPLWDAFSFILSYIQFPWRFLTLSTVVGVVLCTYLISSFKGLFLQLLIGFLIITPLYALHSVYHRPTQYIYVGKYTADDPCGTAGWANEYLTIWTKECLPKGAEINQVNIIKGDVAVKNLNRNKHNREYILQTSGYGEIFIDKYFYPGWKAYLNNAPHEIKPVEPYGLISTSVPDGDNNLIIRYEGTHQQLAGNIVSVVGIIVGALFIARKKYKLTNINPKV